MSHNDLPRTPNVFFFFFFFCRGGGGGGGARLKFRVLTLLLTARVSCLSPWTKQNFPASLKIEETLSHRSTKAQSHSRLLNNWKLRYFQFNLYIYARKHIQKVLLNLMKLLNCCIFFSGSDRKMAQI